MRGRKREQPQAEKRLREIRGAYARAYTRAIADASVRVGRGWRRRGSYINKHRTATEEDGRELLIKGRVQ